nr:testis-expressed protein 30 isoform X2 [Misgurnus anguillicaudatus]
MEFSEENVRIPFEQKQLDGVFTVPADVSAGFAAVVMTHGAGGDLHMAQLEILARVLARSGRSMGARAAIAVGRLMCEVQEDVVQGLLCLSFPLHPPGQTHMHIQRSQDLRALSHTPVMFISGTADNMCEQKLLENVMKLMQCPTAVHWVRGAGHGLTVKGRTEESVLEEVNSQIIAWIKQHK